MSPPSPALLALTIVAPLNPVAHPPGTVSPLVVGGAISIGNFDGVHRGHVALLTRLRRMADRLDCPAVAITFDPPPVRLLRPEAAPQPLTTIARRKQLLRQAGVDAVGVVATTAQWLRQSPEQFFGSLVIESLQARGMVEGPNFHFGYRRAGTPARLVQLCQDAAIDCEIVRPESIDQEMVSSTRIRQLLLSGDLRAANRLLTAAYRLEGVIERGAARGRTLGFPTANLGQIATLVPADGVYAGWVTIGEGQRGAVGGGWAAAGGARGEQPGERFQAAIHIGPNPTFADGRRKVEIHLLGFDGDLYGRTLALDLVDQLRPVRRFSGVEELVGQLKADVQLARQRLQAT